MRRLCAVLGLVLLLTNPVLAATLGGNLSGVSPWQSTWPFVDLVRYAPDWRAPTEKNQWTSIYDLPAYAEGTVALTENGYPYLPGRDFKSGVDGITFFRLALPAGNEAAVKPDSVDYRDWPQGDYTLIFEGTGTVEVLNGGFDQTVVNGAGGVTQRTVRRGPGKGEWTELRIVATSAADPVRGIHLIMPGCADTWRSQPFSRQFLENIAPFRKLRLMTWCEVNASPIQHWDQRTLPGWYSYMGRSRPRAPRPYSGQPAPLGQVPYEVMCDLANATGKDIWVCVPYAADDDYVRHMAQLFHDRLDPAITLTVEYANEIRNPAFPVTAYSVARGKEVYGADLSDGQARTLFEVRRCTDIFRIWNDVYGYRNDQNFLDNPKRRLRFVMPDFLLKPLSEGKYAHAVRIDHGMINFYFGIQFQKTMVEEGWLDKDLGFLFDQYGRVLEELGPKVSAGASAVADFSRATYPITLVGYEGGCHLNMWWNKNIERQTEPAAKRMVNDPRMHGIYMRMFQIMDQNGLDNDNYIFTICGGWSFGQKIYATQPVSDATRYRACLDYIRAQPDR